MANLNLNVPTETFVSSSRAKKSDNFAKYKFMLPGYFVAKQALAGLQIFAVRLEYPACGKEGR